MDKNFRRLALEKIAGVLTDLVEKHYGESKSSDFKSEFLNLGAGPAREKLVYDEVLKTYSADKLRGSMVPVTVSGPGGTKITYNVLPDYLSVDGLRVPMSGQTAQKVADHFDMNLPTSVMSKQIWEAADVKVRPQPLSAGGYIGGKYYSGKDVVSGKISDSDSSIAYNEMIDRDIEQSGKSGLAAGHMKDIIAPEDENKLGLYGWFGKSGDPLEPSVTTGHDTSVHTEYGAGVRLVDGQNITVTRPDGTKFTTTMDDLLDHPEMSKAVAKSRGTRRYSLA